MPNRYQYTRKQHKDVMEYWFKTARILKLTQKEVSAKSLQIFGFHVPASTLSLWIGKYRKHRRSKSGPTVGTTNPAAFPKGVVKVNGQKVRVLSDVPEPAPSIPTEEVLILSELRKANVILQKMESRRWWKLW